MNFDAMSAKNSSLQSDLSYSTKWRSLNIALRYDAQVG